MGLPLPLAVSPESWGSADWPLGPHLDAATNSATFAVHAPAATRVQLEFFTGPTGEPFATFLPAKGADGAWRAKVTNVGPGVHYGYRAWGPTWEFDPAWTPGGSGAGFVCDVDDAGNRFNPNKLLFDPYAREVSHNLLSPLIETDGGDGGMFGTGGDDYRGRPRREFDTARWAPKGIVVDDATPTGTRPRNPPENTALYEAHVKNLTMHPSASRLTEIFAHLPGYADVVDIPEAQRGTYAGAAHLAPYLHALGFTTIELLPVHETNSSDAAVARGEANHWGYQTLSFFAPNRDYAHDTSPGGPTREFKSMVRAFHDAGIEVYLDVVFNHTAEGGHWAGDRDTVGFTSLGGFATPDYYVLTDDHRLIDGATGCSNQTNMSSDAARNLVTDSLIHWADEMGVDGFRFDLAPVLGRLPEDAPREDWGAQRRFFSDHPLLRAVRDLASARDLEVIAEAWDLWGYEVGNFPAGWGEWNGRYRDAVRGFLKGDGNTTAFIDQLNGDYLAFNDQGGPQRSIDFVTAHDGFTMMDLVSYDTKNNGQPFPFGPSDGGSDANLSWDSGGDATVRRQRLRNFWVVLFLSRGVPMVVSGDEFGRTQNGNNNPWALDTVGMWNNWAMATSNAPTQVSVDETHPEYRYHDNFGASGAPEGVNPLFTLATYVANLRRAHPGLRQATYGNTTLDDADVTYEFAGPDGSPPVDGERNLRVHIDASTVEGDDLVMLITMGTEPVTFNLHRPSIGKQWRKIIDTHAYAEAVGNCWHVPDAEVVGDTYDGQPWSVAVLIETSDASVAESASRGEHEEADERARVRAEMAGRVAGALGDVLKGALGKVKRRQGQPHQ